MWGVMAKLKLFIEITFLSIMAIFIGACTQQPTSNSTLPVIYSLPELKYRWIDNYDDLFFVDPDYYPIMQEGQEENKLKPRFYNYNEWGRENGM